MVTVAIGDIHGMYDMLDRLLMEIYAYATQEAWLEPLKMVFLGDYIDRGPGSRKVVRRLRSLQDESVIILRGNHEDLMAKCYDDPVAWQGFLANGGVQTLLSYRRHEDDFEEDRRWMASLPTSYEDERRIYVHAGIRPGLALNDQPEHTKIWIRREFLEFEGKHPKYVVHGHTPTFRDRGGSEDAPDIRKNRCNLDTGAVFGGALTAAFFNEIQDEPFHVISMT